MISCQIEFETIIDFLNSVKLKSIGQSCTLDLLSMHDSVPLWAGHLGNIGSLSYAEIPS